MGQENLFFLSLVFSFLCWRLRRPRPLNSTQLKRRERDRKNFEGAQPLTSVPDYREPAEIFPHLKKEKSGRALESPREGSKIFSLCVNPSP